VNDLLKLSKETFNFNYLSFYLERFGLGASLIVAPFGTMEQEPGDAAGGRRGVVTLEALWAYGKR